VGPERARLRAGSSPHGEIPWGGGSAEARVQARARANRCAKRAPYRQTCGTRVRVCLVSQDIRSASLKRYVDMRKLTGQRHDGRRLGSSLLLLSKRAISRETLSSGGGRWGDPGQAGESVFIRSRMAYEAAAVGSAWNRCDGARGRHKDVRGWDDFDEGSSSRRMDDQARRVSTQNAVRRCRAECSGTAQEPAPRPLGTEGASRSDRPKRA
jgi:hypothetical protein